MIETTRHSNCLVGTSLAAFFFLSVMIFSVVVTFHRDDNVSEYAPLIVEAARQVRAGHLPMHTYYVGGGGGFPLVTPLQPGVLNPFTLVPAIFFSDNPERMTNVMVAVHAGIFAAGSWFLAGALGAPFWARLLGACSLSFSGFFWVWSGNWITLTLPYSFLPWLIGSMVSLCRAGTRRSELAKYSFIAVASAFCMVFGGAPNPTLYGGIALFFCLASVLTQERPPLKTVCVRLIPVCVFIVAITGPLLWEALRVHSYYTRPRYASEWISLSVPLKAYLGLLIPMSSSTWTLSVGQFWTLSNILLSSGFVTIWLTIFWLVRNPLLLLERPVQILIAGLLVFVPIMSPGPFHLAELFARTPVLNGFRWPFRAIPAFHTLTVALFLTLATRESKSRGFSWKWALAVALCIVLSMGVLVHESRIVRKGHEISWLKLTPLLSDRESWSEASLAKMREKVCVMTFCRLPMFWKKPRLFFFGNLGAEYRICTVGHYACGRPSPVHRQAGINYAGMVVNWAKGLRFLEHSATSPVPGHTPWENGVGPKDLEEFAQLTHVGTVVVEKAWKEPMRYFSSSRQWAVLEERKSAVAFQRRTGH